MDPRTKVIIIGLAILLALAGILGVIFVVLKNAQTTSVPSTGNNSLSRLPVISTSPTPAGAAPTTPSVPASNTKTFINQNFTLSYPASWGILICSNTQNIEFDPTSNTDFRNVICDTALKPITITDMIGKNPNGEKVKIGNFDVTRQITPRVDGGKDYDWWLIVNGQLLWISHRVSPSGAPASSKTDFSASVEQMIATIKPPTRGS